MTDIKCKYEVCTCAVPHDLCPHPLGWASEDEVRSLAERLCGIFDRFDGFPMEVAREALRWRDETRPVHAPPAAVPSFSEQVAAEAKSADRTAIRLLVAAGFITEEKANEALCIAHGFSEGPLAPPAAVAVTAAMVERALKVKARIDDGAVFPDDYGDDEAEGERATMRKVLAAALAQQPAAAVPAVRITPRDGKWVYSDNDEVFSSFDHDTELSAIDDALDYYDDAETIYVGQVKTLDVRRMIRAEYLIENIGERAYDDVGEAAEHWPELSKDQQAELEGIIADYILSKSPADFYSVENMRTYTREQAEAMLAAERKGE